MSNKIYVELQAKNTQLAGRFSETREQVQLLLQQYQKNFEQYTDHSADHSERVFNYCADLLSDEALSALNADELYILAMSCFLHDIGMCVSEAKLDKYQKHYKYLELLKQNEKFEYSDFLRSIHHEVSRDFIEAEWESLKIKNQTYAEAIGLVSLGHRKVDLLDTGIYEPKYFLNDGSDFVCLPYLASILRLADELEMSTVRVPDLLTKYFWPENETSQMEWSKSRAIQRINVDTDNAMVKISGTCDDTRIYNALLELCDKIQSVIEYGNRVTNHYKHLCKRQYSFTVNYLEKDIKTSFDFKEIGFSFDIHRITETLVGKALYNDKFVAVREAIQNAIDACLYKSTLLDDNYSPSITVSISPDEILIEDNGMGMNESIIRNYFSKLGASFYHSTELPDTFEPIAQFGIGVFSYFQIADLIEVITKKEGDECVQFKADKTPNTYFYFDKNPVKNDEGTALKLILKDNIDIDSSKLLDYLKHTFKFSEVPININTPYGKLKMEKQPFSIPDEVWHKYVKPSKSKIIKNLKLVSLPINEDHFEGELGIIVANSFNDNNPRQSDTEFSNTIKPIEVSSYLTLRHVSDKERERSTGTDD